MGETRPCRRDKEDFRPLTTCPQGGTYHQTAYIPDGTHHQTAHKKRTSAQGKRLPAVYTEKVTIPVSPSSRVAGISLLTDCRTAPALISWQEHNGEKDAHMAGKGMLTEAGQLPQGINDGQQAMPPCRHAWPRTATNNNQGEDKPAPTESPKEEQRCTTCGMARQ